MAGAPGVAEVPSLDMLLCSRQPNRHVLCDGRLSCAESFAGGSAWPFVCVSSLVQTAVQRESVQAGSPGFLSRHGHFTSLPAASILATLSPVVRIHLVRLGCRRV